MTREAERQRAHDVAWALGMKIYLREDGTLAQFPPGELIDPGPRAQPSPHGVEPKAPPA